MIPYRRLGCRVAIRLVGLGTLTAASLAGLCPASAQAPGAKAPPASGDSARVAGPGAGALRPGDAIRLKIWREPDLSGDFPVEEDGVVVLPKIGRTRVTAEHPDSLKAQLVRTYATYLVNPSIQVQILRRIQVLGAVRTPGLYSVDPTMTIADALALAGGVTPQGRSNKVELRRAGEKVSGLLAGRLLIADSPIRSGDQVFVPERSWISRNPGILIGALGLVSTVVWRVAR